MEHSVQLGTQNYRNSICDRLTELKEQESLPFKIRESRQGKHWLIQCDFDLANTESKEIGTMTKIHRYYLANALADTILNNWEHDYVRNQLKRKYRLLNEENDEVLEKAFEYLNGKGKSQYYQVNRKTYLVQQILDSIESDTLFEVEGFLHFRAKNYKDEVDKAVSLAVEEYIIQKEYLEFIYLLKRFLDTQSPRMDTLHVGISSLGKFHLYDETGEKVTKKFLDECSLDEENGEFSYEDLLISSLIAVAPRQIVLHICYEGYQDTLQTIKQVFKGRVSYCSGCSICEKL